MCICDSNVPRLQGSSPSDALLLSGKFELLCLKQTRGINISNKKDRSILSRHIIVFMRLKQKKLVLLYVLTAQLSLEMIKTHFFFARYPLVC